MNVLGVVIIALLSGISMHAKEGAFFLASPAFMHGGQIPAKFTCDGADISPRLTWYNPPMGTKSFALIVDDPDAPNGDWVHWVVYNIPATVTELKEGVNDHEFETGMSSFGDNPQRYGGPCPPKGTHHYHFKLYALDTLLQVSRGMTKKGLLAAMKGHILGQAELVGVYQRTKK